MKIENLKVVPTDVLGNALPKRVIRDQQGGSEKVLESMTLADILGEQLKNPRMRVRDEEEILRVYDLRNRVLTEIAVAFTGEEGELLLNAIQGLAPHVYGMVVDNIAGARERIAERAAERAAANSANKEA